MKLKHKLLLFGIALVSSMNLFSQVTVNGRQLFVNGEQYRINGICYSTRVGDYNQDIALMKEANINTIRTYWYIDDQTKLDAFANAGIKIIMHLNENDYEWYVNKYKNHPAILMWEFGNEFNYHPEWFGGNLWNWYGKLQECALRTKQLDSNHPVTTAHGEVPPVDVINFCSAVDVWGMNLYRWDNDVPAINDLASRTNKGIYVSECGGDSYDKANNRIDENAQATANKNILNGIVDKFDVCMGATLFEFCDEWWKAGSPDVQNPGGSAPNSSGVPYDGSPDEEYWGIVRRDRSKKPAFYEVQSIYGRFSQVQVAIKVEAETYIYSSDVQTEPCYDDGGGLNVGWIDNNDWMVYNVDVPKSGLYNVEYRIASPNSGGVIQLEAAGGGTVYGSTSVPYTGGWQKWEPTNTHTANLSAGQQLIAIKANVGGFNVNWFKLTFVSAQKSAQIASTNELTEEVELSVYPNPAKNVLNIKGLQDDVLLEVYNMAGKKVLSQKGQQVQTEELIRGVYMLMVNTNNEIKRLKFVKD